MKSKKPKVVSKELNHLIRTAALAVDTRGSIPVLAKKAGLTSAIIHLGLHRGYFTAGVAAALELAVGRELLPKEKLAPHKFAK